MAPAAGRRVHRGLAVIVRVVLVDPGDETHPPGVVMRTFLDVESITGGAERGRTLTLTERGGDPVLLPLVLSSRVWP